MAEDKKSKTEEQTKEEQPDKEKQIRWEKLQFFMNCYGTYHNHKENMAWVATAFYIGGIVYLTNALHDIACTNCSWQVAFTVLFILTGTLALIFVNWQFERRKEAADRVSDCYFQIMQKLQDFPSADREVKSRWELTNPNRPDETRWLSIIAIIGITIAAVVILNVWCS